jgi:hypothetical protein
VDGDIARPGKKFASLIVRFIGVSLQGCPELRLVREGITSNQDLSLKCDEDVMKLPGPAGR